MITTIKIKNKHYKFPVKKLLVLLY